MRRVLLILMLAATAGSVPALAGETATPPPPVVTLVEGAGPYSPDDVLAAEVQGARQADVTLVWGSSAGDRTLGHTSGDGTSRTQIDGRLASGRWRLDRVVVQEGGRSLVYQRDGHVEGSTSDAAFSARHTGDFTTADFDVDNDAADVVAPHVTSLSTGTIRVRPGEYFGVELGVADEGSYVDSASLSFFGEDFARFFLPLEEQRFRATRAGTRLVGLVDPSAEAGTYTLNHVTVVDQAGNSAGYDPGGRRRVFPTADGSEGAHDLPLTSLVVQVDPLAPVDEDPAAADGPVHTAPRPVDGPPAARLDLTAPAATVAYGDVVVVSGRALGASGAPAPRARVHLTGRRAGQSETLIGSAVSGTDGQWQFSFVPYAGLTVRGATSLASSGTAVVTLAPELVLRVPLQPAAARAAYDVVAVAAPAQDGAAVRLERLLPTGTWLQVASAVQDSSGRARFSRTELLAGPVTYRAVLDATPGYTGATATAVADVR